MNSSRKGAKAQRKLESKAVGLGQTIHDSLHAVLEKGGAKVDQETESFFSKANLGKNLLAVDWREFLNGLQFNDHKVLHNHVSAKTLFEDEVVVPNQDCYLPLNIESTFSQFVPKDHFIHSFQESWTKSFVNLKRSIHDDLRDIVLGHRALMFVSSAHLLNLFAPLRLCVRHS
jgi:hypothetical protein